MSDTRKKLRDAITAKAAAAQRVTEAKAAFVRATTLVGCAHNDLRDLGDPEAEIEALRSQATAKLIANGGAVIDEVEIPVELQQRRLRAIAGQKKLNQVRGAEGQLGAELAKAEQFWRECDVTVRSYAADVLKEYADHLAGRLHHALCQVTTVRQELAALGAVWVYEGGRYGAEVKPKPIELSSTVRIALDFASAAINGMGVRGPDYAKPLCERTNWESLLRALEHDPDTVLPGEIR